MQTLEDAVDLIAGRFASLGSAHAFAGLLGDAWTLAFVRTVKLRVDSGEALTCRQAGVVLSLLAKVRGPLAGYGLATTGEIERLLAQPRYRTLPHDSPLVEREVVHLGDNCLGFRFPWDPGLVDRIKSLHHLEGRSTLPVYDCEHGIWIVPVDRHTLEALVRLIGEGRFSYGEAVVAFLEACEAARDQPCVFTTGRAGEPLRGTIRDNELLAAWALHVARGERR